MQNNFRCHARFSPKIDFELFHLIKEHKGKYFRSILMLIIIMADI